MIMMMMMIMRSMMMMIMRSMMMMMMRIMMMIMKTMNGTDILAHVLLYPAVRRVTVARTSRPETQCITN